MVGAARKRQRALTSALLVWYDEHQRELPWRRLRNPYATWVSEIMLQQTQVATVVPYFERWMQRFPTIHALAKANTHEVLSAWQGLGYYSRARNLQRSAQLICSEHSGRLPANAELLQKLPGIGRYTAGAIASIAFNLPEPAVDGNVLRVLTRLDGLRGDPRVEPLSSQIWQIASDLMDCVSPGSFNQALMELGALVCVPEKPRCGQCPVLKHCVAKQLDLAEQLPELPKRPKPVARRVVVVLAERQGKWLVVQQPDSARHWAGLFTFPYAELLSGEKPQDAIARLLAQIDAQATLDSTDPLTRFTYPITRFRFQALVYLARGVRAKQATQFRAKFAAPEALANLALPAPHRRLVGVLHSPRGA